MNQFNPSLADDEKTCKKTGFDCICVTEDWPVTCECCYISVRYPDVTV